MDADTRLMSLAIEQAKCGLRTPGGAEVGAVLVLNGQVLAAAFNEGELQHDPTAHAEMVALRRAGARLRSTALKGSVLYCTLQPCGMCTMACLWAGVSRIVFGAGREDVNEVYFETRQANTVDFICDAFRSDLQVDGGILREVCASLYRNKDEAVPGNDPAHDKTKKPL
jgi:tRNA(adenine34) deaminase